MSNDSINSRMGHKEWSMLLSLAALWGASFFVISIAVKEIPPLTLVALRVAIAAVVLWAYVLWRGEKIPRSPVIWRAFLIMGILNNAIPFSLIIWGQKSIPGGLASILNAAVPLFTVFVASYFLADEKLTRLKLFGSLLGFGGVAVMIGPDALQGMSINVFAQLAVLCAALSYAFAGTWGRRFRDMQVPSSVVAAAQLTMSTMVIVPLSLILENPLSLAAPSYGTWVAVLALAIPCSSLAYILYFRILSSAGAVNLSLVTLLIPIFAVIPGAVFLGEQLGWEHLVGILLIAAGLSAIDGRLLKKRT